MAERWAVIEKAGYEGENVRASDFTSFGTAYQWMCDQYPSAKEREDLHVDIAIWDTEGGFWSYDY